MGKAWTYGANIDTDLLAPIEAYKSLDPKAGAVRCLEALDPTFGPNVKLGDIFVATDNLGIGSSREYAPQFLKWLGIEAVIAQSFARIFYRNCFNIGLPALVLKDVSGIEMGDEVTVDPAIGEVRNATKGTVLMTDPVPPHLMEMIAAGGLMAHLKQRFAQARAGS